MLEEFDGRMIEIGDPTEEPAAPESPARVVIEYRERGVPWMLIPPLLVISAVGAILAYHKLVPRPRPQPHVLVQAPALLETPEDNDEPADPIKPKPPENKPTPAPTVANPPPDVPPAVVKPEPAPVAADPPAVIVAPPVGPSSEPPKEPEPPAFPRVQGLGFDPRALEAGAKPEAPADKALAPAGREGRADEPGPAIGRVAPPDAVDQPREVDPDLLPPDPRLAQARRAKRLAELRQMAEEERGRYLADLKDACRKYRDRAGPEIFKIHKRYDATVEPALKKRAIFLLGKTGPYVGADRGERIKLLRKLGYPEPAILEVLFDLDKTSIGERDGPRDEFEALYFSAVFLVRHPPPGLASTSRALAAPGSAR